MTDRGSELLSAHPPVQLARPSHATVHVRPERNERLVCLSMVILTYTCAMQLGYDEAHPGCNWALDQLPDPAQRGASVQRCRFVPCHPHFVVGVTFRVRAVARACCLCGRRGCRPSLLHGANTHSALSRIAAGTMLVKTPMPAAQRSAAAQRVARSRSALQVRQLALTPVHGLPASAPPPGFARRPARTPRADRTVFASAPCRARSPCAPPDSRQPEQPRISARPSLPSPPSFPHAPAVTGTVSSTTNQVRAAVAGTKPADVKSFKNLTPEVAKDLYTDMVLGREFEEMCAQVIITTTQQIVSHEAKRLTD